MVDSPHVTGVSSTNARQQHSYLFMGGLQRSGTTWLEGLVASQRVSGLSFDNVDMTMYRQQQPWVLQNHTQEYFEMVVRSGGVEGKFVQDAYPYTYLVRDVGRRGIALDDLLIDDQAASAEKAERLYAEWSLFWDTTRPVLLEKTPENLLMGPFLQAAFGATNTRFAFVMRHPLVWALAIEKWIFPDFATLRTVEDRVAFWFACMERAVEHLPQLRDAMVLQLETVSASMELQSAVAGHLLCTTDVASNRSSGSDLGSLAPPDLGGETEILSSSMAYVTCWLSGMEFKSSLHRCVPRKAFRDPSFRQQSEELAADNRWRLKQLARQREAHANQFGYTFKPFLALARKQTPAVLRERVTVGPAASMSAQLGVAQSASAVRVALRPYLAVPPPSSAPQPTLSVAAPASLASGSGVILVFHKMGFDREHPSGMDLRMTQIVSSLVALQHTVHFVCHCDVHASQLSPFPANVVIYTGSLREQFYQALESASPVRSVLIFFTTLTMSVHQRMLQGEADWHMEPTTPLPEEQVLSWVRARPKLQACTVAVADDIHYLRAVEVMARHDVAKARLASEWIRRRELGFHSAVDGTATVSLEDAETLKGALAGHATTLAPRPVRCSSGCACSMVWVPYVQATRSEGSVEPFYRRHEGMLYVGGMHGLAVIAIEWLLDKVQPLIRGASSRGALELLQGGKGHLHLAGPGWAQHAVESRVLNESVTSGYVSILGTLSDMQLDQRLRDHKVFVAPVLNGTGIATKNVLAMAHGIPLVTTLVGLNGLGLPLDQRAILVADSPSGFARHVLKVQSSESMFNVTWRAALEHARTYLSAGRQQAQLCRIIRCTPPPTVSSPPRHAAPTAADGSGTLCEANRSRWPLHRASEVVQALPNRSGLPVVLLGLAGTNVSAVAASLRSSRVCLVADPLQGLARAPLQTQLDHLRSLLDEPYYCQGAGQEVGHVGSPHPLVQGFAVELASVEQVPTSLLASASGLSQFAQLLTSAKVVVVRRCSPVMWAMERLLLPSGHCSTPGACSPAATRLVPTEVIREAETCSAQDKALRALLDASGVESTSLYVEGSAAHVSAAAGQLSQLRAFLRLPHAHTFGATGKSKGVVTGDWTSDVDRLQGMREQLNSYAMSTVSDNCNGTTIAKGDAAPTVSAALSTLTARTRQRRPLLVVGAHGTEGGAALVAKVLAEACREFLTPRLGWRCVTRDGFENCDPDADLCFHKQAHFSAGRLVDRGYRFVHIVRSPIDVLTRSYQLLEPNATHVMNSSALLSALEAHWKRLSGGLLHAMQDMVESHASDPHALKVHLEDLLPDQQPNATLAKLFAFLLNAEPSDSRVEDLLGAVAKVLPSSGRAELQGDTQRKHLAKLLTRKPAKCQHVTRVQQAMNYPALLCSAETTNKASAGGGDGGSSTADGALSRHRPAKKRTRRRRLAEIDEPRSRAWRLAAAWV